MLSGSVLLYYTTYFYFFFRGFQVSLRTCCPIPTSHLVSSSPLEQKNKEICFHQVSPDWLLLNSMACDASQYVSPWLIISHPRQFKKARGQQVPKSTEKTIIDSWPYRQTILSMVRTNAFSLIQACLWTLATARYLYLTSYVLFHSESNTSHESPIRYRRLCLKIAVESSRQGNTP